MKVNKFYNLVAVIDSVRGGGPFGVTVDVAREGLAAGELTLADIPDDIETYEVPDVAGGNNAKVAAKGVADSIEAPATDVAIPEDWQSLHHMKRIRLAQQLFGEYDVPEGVQPTEMADRLIAREVTRRLETNPAPVETEEDKLKAKAEADAKTAEDDKAKAQAKADADAKAKADADAKAKADADAKAADDAKAAAAAATTTTTSGASTEKDSVKETNKDVEPVTTGAETDAAKAAAAPSPALTTADVVGKTK